MTQSYTEGFVPLSEGEHWLPEQIVTIPISIHKSVVTGLLESVYEKCFCYELSIRNIPYKKQQCVDIRYGDFVIADGLRIDILVEKEIIVEAKSVEALAPINTAQILSHLKLSDKHLGFLINFNEVLLKNGFRRFVYNYFTEIEKR